MGLTAVFAVFVVASLCFATTLPCKAKCPRKTETDLRAIDSALEEYAEANAGQYPKSLQALVTPDMNGYTFLKGTKIPKDPWGNEYMYDPPEPGRPEARVYSYGKDGVAGGKGEDADIDDFSLRVER